MRSIIRVAHDLGKQVVAEHVADQQTLDLVRQEGADFVQGFHIGKPMPAEDFVESFLPDHGSGSTSSGTHRVPTQAGE
jgi:EAL domain-containing protein (putative c-di-GMP-specific phosphodiesterase class I)